MYAAEMTGRSICIHLIIAVQVIMAGYLKYLERSEDSHVTFDKPGDWIKPILRFHERKQVGFRYIILVVYSKFQTVHSHVYFEHHPRTLDPVTFQQIWLLISVLHLRHNLKRRHLLSVRVLKSSRLNNLF